MSEDEYKFCEDFCPLYEAIEEYNNTHITPICCSRGIDCSYIAEIVKENRERVRGGKE